MTPTGLDCDRIDPPREHWIYPITGKIGLAELISSYIRLEKMSGTVKKFIDTLTFTTVFNASVTPSVTLNPGPLKRFRLASASASLTASRTDLHEVAVALGKPSTVPVNVNIPLGMGAMLSYPSGSMTPELEMCPADVGAPALRPQRVSRRPLFYISKEDAARSLSSVRRDLNAAESLQIQREILDVLPDR